MYQLTLLPPPHPMHRVGCIQITISHLNIRFLYRMLKNHASLPHFLSYFDLKLHVLTFDDILRKLQIISLKVFKIISLKVLLVPAWYGMGACCIRTVPKIERSVNGPL